MPSAAGIILTTGALTLASEMLQDGQPLTSPASKINWRVIPATAIAAVVFSQIEAVNSKLGIGLAYIALATSLIVPFGNHKSIILTLTDLMGYTKGTASPGVTGVMDPTGSYIQQGYSQYRESPYTPNNDYPGLR